MAEPKYEVGQWFKFVKAGFKRTISKKYQVVELVPIIPDETKLYYIDDNGDENWLFARNTVPCKAPEPEIDTGEDLIGRRVRRKSGAIGVLEKHPTKLAQLILKKDGGGKYELCISNIREWFELGTWTFIDEPVKEYTREELLNLQLKVASTGKTFRMEIGYNNNVLRRVEPETGLLIAISEIGSINERISSGTYIVLQGEPPKPKSPEPVYSTGIPSDLVVNGSFIADSTITANTQTQWQQYNTHTEEYSCAEPEFIKTEEKGNEMNTNNITISVPMSAFAVTETITVFGRDVIHFSEEELYTALTKIDAEQGKLKEINKTAKSARIRGQISKLGELRNKLTEYIDRLPEAE